MAMAAGLPCAVDPLLLNVMKSHCDQVHVHVYVYTYVYIQWCVCVCVCVCVRVVMTTVCGVCSLSLWE